MRRAAKHSFMIECISLADYFMGRDATYAQELSAELRANAALIVARTNQLLTYAEHTGIVNSGWRPRTINAAVPNASPRSKHLTCQAVDLADEDGSLDRWCLDHLPVLEQIGLWLEHPRATPGWCHVQTVAPRSGRRVFMP